MLDLRILPLVFVPTLACGPKDALATSPEPAPVPAPEAAATGGPAPIVLPERVEPPAPTAAALERIAAVRKQEVAPLADDPRLTERIDPCTAKFPDEDPFDVGQVLAVELVRVGLPSLSDDQLRRWNEIRDAMARNARQTCAVLWAGELIGPQLEAALAGLDEAMVRDFFRLRTAAGRSALEAQSYPARDPEGIAVARGKLQAELSEPDWARMQEGLAAPELSLDDACFLQLAVMGTARRLPPADEARTLRALLAESGAIESSLPTVCIGIEP
jgi:hypothetical protein